MTLSYRAGAPDDAEAIDRVFRASFCQTFAHLYRPEDLAAFLGQFTLDAWRTELSDPAFAFLVAEADGGIVGYAKLGPLKLAIEPSGTARLLSQLYVLPSHAGAGIAELYLTVFVDNRRARRFYARYGFEAVGRYDFMVGSQADEDIIMRKVL